MTDLSSLQRSIILNQQLYPDDASYNLPYFWKLTGKVNIEKLYSALMNAFNNHDIYHSYVSGGKIVTDKSTVFRPRIYELSYSDNREFENSVINKVKEFANRPFNVNIWPLQEAIIFVNTKKTADEYFLFVNVSHLICDVTSAYELITEINNGYNNGPIEKINIEVSSSITEINKKREKRAIDYFTSRLKLVKSLEQPVIQLDKTLPRKNGDIILDKNLVNSITSLSGNTEFEVLSTAYIILLSKLTSKNIITVGVPLANRGKSKRHAHGCFVNNLPLIINLTDSTSVKSLLNDVAKNLHNLIRFQSFDLQNHIKELTQDTGSNYGFMNNSVTFYKKAINFNFKDVNCQNIIIEQSSPMFPLAMEFENSGDAITMHIQVSGQYNPELIGEYYKDILSKMSNLSIDIDEASSMGNTLVQELIKLENRKLSINNDTPYKSVLELFSQECSKHPDSVAVRYNETSLSYKEVDNLSNIVASQLLAKTEERIVVSVEPSSYLIILMLAIFKSGKVYVPLDKIIPEERKKVILEQLDNFAIITDENSYSYEGYEVITIKVLFHDVKIDSECISKKDKYIVNDIAYMIFTSGSTGTPKGVEVSHESLLTLMCDVNKKITNTFKKQWILFHSYGFDYSIFEILAPLSSGGTLNVVPQSIRKFPDLFREFLIENKINILTQTPSAFLSLQRVDSVKDNFINTLEYIFIGGEDIKFKDLSPWFSKYGYNNPKVFNLYGLTETTIISTAHQINKNDVETKQRNNIGYPIGNTLLRVVNRDGSLVLPGFEGELIISGPAIANGYYKNPEKTSKVFIKNDNSFKTGDLVKVLSNGELQYINRIDKQVQISGHRVELGEIESAINGCPFCEESYVIAKDFNIGDRRLIAYYKLTETFKITSEQIRNEIKNKLPDYMLPAFWIEVTEFPLNASGKIDESRLPDVIELSNNTCKKSKVSRNDSTCLSRIQLIWSEVLKTDIDQDDNFFEAGGTSVLITEVYYRILKEFNLSEEELSMIDLFDYVTPLEVSQFIEEKLRK